MILSDTAILKAIERGQIVIEPFNEAQLNGASYDLSLSSHGAFYRSHEIDMKNPNHYQVERFEIPKDGYWLKPNKLYLLSTKERTYCDPTIVPKVEGKSSVGRLGMEIHRTAGWGDPEFNGHWTLEVTVTQRLKVYPDVLIGQVIFSRIEGDVNNHYGLHSNYQDQEIKPQPSKLYKQFKK